MLIYSPLSLITASFMDTNTTTAPPTETRAVVAVTLAGEKSVMSKEVDQSSKEEVAKRSPVKRIIGPLSIFCVILSIPFLFVFIWLLVTGTHACESLLNLQKLQMGTAAGMFILFAASNIVVLLRSRLGTIGLFLVMVPSIFMLIVGLGLVGAFKMQTQDMPGSPRWLRVKVHDNYLWNEIKSCIYDTRTCRNLISKSYLLKSYDFTSSKLSQIESGCCVPPENCGMDYVNATYWKKGDGNMDSSNPYDRDCDVWQNDETVLCYNCEACREGFLRPLKSKWSKFGGFFVVMSVFLILAHLVLFVATMIEKLAAQ